VADGTNSLADTTGVSFGRPHPGRSWRWPDQQPGAVFLHDGSQGARSAVFDEQLAQLVEVDLNSSLDVVACYHTFEKIERVADVVLASPDFRMFDHQKYG
jgi:hypothetical protein